MARTCRRGARAAGDAAARSPDERRAEHGRDAVDLALRAVGRHHDVPGTHRRLLRAPGGVPANGRCAVALGRDAGPVAAVQSVRAGLSLCHREPGPKPAGAEDARGLGGRACVQVGAGRGGRFRVWRHRHAVPGAARSGEDLQLSHPGAPGAGSAGGEQCERGRRVLLAGLAVLLCARTGAGDQDRGHRRHRRRQQQRRAGARSRCGRGDDWQRAASGRIRLPEERRLGRGRHPDAARRADAECARRRREEDRRAESRHPAAGRQDPPVLRPQRPGAADDRQRSSTTCWSGWRWC